MNDRITIDGVVYVRADEECEDADTARIVAEDVAAAKGSEITELRNGIFELLDALQIIYNEECTSYGTEKVYNKWRKALEGEE